jgi:hypothetical protein
MKCDFWSSLLVHTLASSYFGRKPKVRVATHHFVKKQIEYQIAIFTCYGCQQSFHLSTSRLLVCETWVVGKTIVDILFPLVKLCVFNEN